jgi:hypothetical protein
MRNIIYRYFITRIRYILLDIYLRIQIEIKSMNNCVPHCCSWPLTLQSSRNKNMKRSMKKDIEVTSLRGSRDKLDDVGARGQGKQSGKRDLPCREQKSLCVSGGLSTSLYGAEEHKEAE